MMRAMPRFGLNRRGFLGGLATLAGSEIGGRRLFAATGASAGKQGSRNGKFTGLGESGNIYAELGLTTIINAHLTETVIGGSLIRPEAMAAMEMAAKHFVVMMDLEAAVGRRISEMLKLPQGYGTDCDLRRSVSDSKRICGNSYGKQSEVYYADPGSDRHEVRGDRSAGALE
jgi:L-seryl-tRNA(Ser) seleniumtransferase